MGKVNLISSDNQSFVVDMAVAKVSRVIRTLLEDLGEDEENKIPVLTVRADILKLVIEWAEHHRNDPLEDDRRRDPVEIQIPEWDKNFLKVEVPILGELNKAADYLDIKGLYDMTLQTFTNILRGNEPEEIRRILNLRNDLHVPAPIEWRD